PDLVARGLKESYEAAYHLYWMKFNQNMTNFPHFLTKTQVEALPEAVKARRLIAEAEQMRKRAEDPERAIRVYNSPDALPAWKKILTEHPDFRRDSTQQEDTYEWELKYLKSSQEALQAKLRNEKNSDPVSALLLLQQCLARATMDPAVPERWLLPEKLVRLPP